MPTPPEDIAFDKASSDYDASFTYSLTGRLQRESVWRYLSSCEYLYSPRSILELNCGTGEDACWLAGRGHRVVATDLSGEMIRRTEAKIKSRGAEGITAFMYDMRKLPEGLGSKLFEIVFSDFGGLNCLSPEEIRQLFKSVFLLLPEGGRFIAVVMGRHCLQEQAYFLLKGNREQAFRRQKKGAVAANVSGVTQATWYYDPEELKALSGAGYVVRSLRPVGFGIPPSYLDRFFQKKTVLRSLLVALEKAASPFRSAARYADHYYIEFEKQSS